MTNPNPSPAPDEPMLERIRKLLAKAQDPACTPAEADAFSRKAEELIAKYGIARALLAHTGAVRDEVADKQLVLHDPYSRQQAEMLSSICAPLRVRVVHLNGASRGIKGFKIHMFGMASDLDRAELLFTSLLVQAWHGMAKAHPGANDWGQRPSASAVAAYRRDWLGGFAHKVALRLHESEQRAAQEADRVAAGGTSTELVLVDRTKKVDAAIRIAYPSSKTVKGRAVRAADAFRGGMAAGAVADLGGARINGSRSTHAIAR